MKGLIGIILFIVIVYVVMMGVNEESAKIDKVKDDRAAAKQEVVKRLAPKYCKNQQAVKVKVTDEAKADGWPINDGSGWTDKECKTIISKLYDKGADKKELEVVTRGNYGIGMQEMSLLYSLGSPGDLNKTNSAGYTRSQYVYGDPLRGALYVYTENGIVTSVQN